MDKAPAACTLRGVEGPWQVVVGTGGPKVGNAFAALHPVLSLGTLRVTVLSQGLPAPAVPTTELSPSPCTATWQVPSPVHTRVAGPQTQPCSVSLGTATQQVPVPRYGHVAGPCPQA